MTISFKEILRRTKINGITLPIFGLGITWEVQPSELEIGRKLLIFLADKRAIYRPWNEEISEFVVNSILQIRERLTEDLEKLEPKSVLGNSIRSMQIACEDFLSYIQPIVGKYNPREWKEEETRFFIGLGKLRYSFGIQIANIAISMKIDVDERLDPILPGGYLFKEKS